MPTTLHRQAASTSLPELHSADCSAFTSITDTANFVGLLYIRLRGTWHRFFLDAGLLFWDEGPSPDPEADLLEGETYTDLADTLRINGAAIDEIVMHDSHLRITFTNGAKLVLQQGPGDEETRIVELVPGTDH
ncbi:MAG: hypothetical protein HC927_01845 [Deltaproteobacteria bacterium]|nr:hypothetical protein [Deltaproteobacteria bacterium]